VLIAALWAALAMPALARETDTAYWRPHDERRTSDVDHTPWQRLLDTYLVEDTPSGIHRFDYGAVTAADREALRRYLGTMGDEDPRRLSRDAQYAFWVNLYNALTVELVLTHYPVDSIRDIGGVFRRGPWERELVSITGKALTLDDIEHRILRPIWGDPRTHYAVNCASLGCPDLAAKAYTAASLDERLDEQARAFVNHRRGVRFDDGRLVLSSLYRWYREDFGDGRDALLAHLARYAGESLASRLEAFDGRIEYQYDWRLNDALPGG
jgi:hypothetical protein